MGISGIFFLVHNGCFFQDLTGAYTWLIVFIGGLFLLTSVCTCAMIGYTGKGWFVSGKFYTTLLFCKESKMKLVYFSVASNEIPKLSIAFVRKSFYVGHGALLPMTMAQLSAVFF